jgi:type IV secretory pathway TraG/TraD family ATPase VirD4
VSIITGIIGYVLSNHMLLLALLVLAAMLVLLAVILHQVIGREGQAKNRTRALRWRIWLRMCPGSGWASATELTVRWSRMMAVSSGKRSRPGMSYVRRLFGSAHSCSVYLGRAQWGRRIWASLELQMLIIAAPRSGKTLYLASRILRTRGPVLATTTRDDLFRMTSAYRSDIGPVHVFNPQGVGTVRSTFRWNVIAGCADPATADRRAGSLCGAVSAGDMAFWQSKAKTALAALMHAADLGKFTIADVFAWCNRLGDEKAVEILSTDSRASRELSSSMSEIMKPGKTADSIRITMSKALGWLAIPEIAEAVSGKENGFPVFDIDDWLSQNGTLYLIANEADDQSPVAPLFRALADEVHYVAGIVGSRQRHGKLDPPAFWALDEVAALCPVNLPAWMADSAGRGILIAAVVHGMGQLAGRWGSEGAQVVWATSGIKVILGGLNDVDTLEHLSRLNGKVGIKTGRGDKERTDQVLVVPPELIRKLPRFRALILAGNLSPVVTRLPLGKDWRVKRLNTRASRAVAAQQASPALAQAAVLLDLDPQEHGIPVSVPVSAGTRQTWPESRTGTEG